jgi:hypothetical protein
LSSIDYISVINQKSVEEFVKKILTSALVVAAAFGVSNAVAEDDVSLSLAPEVGFFSDYMWRGQNLYDGSSIQPQITAAADVGDLGVFSANVWSHVSGEDKTDQQFTEIDYKLDYTVALDIVSLSAGHIWYTYESNHVGAVNSAEYYAGIALDVIAQPSFTYYRDYDEADTNYFELGFSHTFEDTCGMGEGFNVTPYATFGFTDENASAYAENGLVQATIGLSSDLKLGHIDVVPSFHYTFESDDVADNQFWMGITLGHLFEL